ncbi:DUF3231 family protein [Halobacillus naozhouensis]|uniref:DUF3231 family protein n=1 Tax=Halobacillus naozhouensis TaxID=554880 RepID=A0ABY8J176_9BACI|nr:DUF3231 family protein [Halobacillus naozhouensis]WFT76258.1 DUF3231 family protein [Halobacillus naozhouensis]
METNAHVELTSAEISNLWTSYVQGTMMICGLRYFLAKVEDPEISGVLGYALDKVFSSLLEEEHLPSPQTWDHTVMDSIVYTFSDKLMMFHITALIASGIGQHGIAMSDSPRRDLGLHYLRLAGEIAKYSEYRANILIDKGWLEQPSIGVDRKTLARKKD